MGTAGSDAPEMSIIHEEDRGEEGSMFQSLFYSICVDSTPDISHMDQLPFIIRDVDEDGVPIE